jgi:hypothetical protein
VFENRELKIMFGPKREEAAGDWRRLHNEELHNLYASPNTIRVMKSRRMRWVDDVVRMGQMRDTYNILVAKPERKTPLGRPRHRQEDNIRMYLREMGWDVWTGLIWLRIETIGGLL